MEKIVDLLAMTGLASTQARTLFLAHCRVKQYARNDLVFAENQKNTVEYFLLDGVAHRYNTDEKGDLITTGFYMGGSVLTPHFARTIEGRSIFSLQALAPLEMAEIPVTDLDRLRHTYPEFQSFGQKVVERELAKNLLADIAYRSHTARERLLLLRESFPNLENLVPHHHIASYLGITPVSFSRLRGELARL